MPTTQLRGFIKLISSIIKCKRTKSAFAKALPALLLGLKTNSVSPMSHGPKDFDHIAIANGFLEKGFMRELEEICPVLDNILTKVCASRTHPRLQLVRSRYPP